jgi:hypothetical protein
MSAAHSAASQGTRAPLKRTDTSTWVDGRPFEEYADPRSNMPRFEPQTPTANRPTGSTNNSAQPTSLTTPAPRKVGTMKVLVNRPTNDGASAGAHTASTNQPTLPTPARPHAGATPSGAAQDKSRHAGDTLPTSSHRPHISKNPGDARNVASRTSPNQNSPRTTQQSGQNFNSSRVGPNERQMPANANASITGHGDRHVVSRSQVVANARSVQHSPDKPGTFPHMPRNLY